jgi:hypothetical protein
LLKDRARLEELSAGMRRMNRPDAAARIAAMALAIAR